jgi:ethanolamine utilization protein EutA (predicted chaperonin)
VAGHGEGGGTLDVREEEELTRLLKATIGGGEANSVAR